MQEVYRLIARAAPTDSTVLDSGRDRHGQGVGGPRDPSQQPAREGTVRSHQLRGADGEACWRASCSGMSEGRSPGPSRRRRASSRWPTAARSFWTRSARCRRRADQAAARCAGARVRAGGRHADHPRGCPDRGGHQPRPASGCAKGAVPRGSVLPAERGAHQLPALRERREDIPLPASYFLARCGRGTPRVIRDLQPRQRLSESVRLARQRAGIAARDRERGGAGLRRY